MSEPKNECRTVLLDDAPATEDAFGPHARIADAIVSLIASEDGGRAIGLEGGWGAGKSTVVNFMRAALQSEDKYRVITFDAWAHEGDPLRRTYLESIVQDLSEAKWIDKEPWDKTLDELANRRKSTTTRITPKPTWLGGIFAVSLVLVPIGTTLVTAAFRQGGDANVANLSTWPGIAYVGSAVALAPVWVLALNFVRVLLRDAFIWVRSITPWTVKRARRASDWSFLLSKAIEETRTDTTETPNPTSIEFESHFTHAMNEALHSAPRRRLVLVLDNLDRVDTNSAISIWSTLQTFLQERNSMHSTWFKQIWLVVPYDPAGLRQLWDNWRATSASEDEGTDTSSTRVMQQRIASDSFIDKSFQIRFQVPPPVLSDWKIFLCKLIEIAFPDHNEADRHIIYRVDEEWRSSHAMPPTPRDLKLYVNQIGAIHRQWQHEFPIGHVASYVLHSRQGDSLIEQLKSGDFPSANIRRLFKEDIIPSLAGLTFNTPAHKGMELLLSDPIYNCLSNGTGTQLVELCESHKHGFWAVTERVVTSRIVGAPSAVIAHTGRVIFDAGILDGDQTMESQAIRSTLKDTVTSVQNWLPLDNSMAEGICSIHRLFNERELSASVMKSVGASVGQSKANEKKQETANVPIALLAIMKTVTDLAFDDVIPESISIPGDVETWMTICETLNADGANEQYIKHFRPKEKTDAIATAIQTAVGKGEFSERHIATVIVTTKAAAKTDWSSVVTAIQNRLDANAGASADEMRPLLRGLWELRNLGDGKAAKSLKTLVNDGHIAHHLHQSAKHKEGAALCQFTMLHADPTVATPPAVANSASGHQLLTNALASSDKQTARMLCDTIQKYGSISELFEFIDARASCDPLLATCLLCIAEGEQPQELFTGEVILNRWEQIQDALPGGDDDRPFDNLIGTLADHNNLCDVVLANKKSFAAADAVLYWTIVLAGMVKRPEFYNWCKEGLERLDKDAWLSDLNRSDECVWLACLLSDKGVRATLTTHLADALAEHAAEVIKGENVLDEVVIERWHDVLSLLEENTRKALRARLLSVAIKANGHISDQFLAMYGDELARSDILASNSRTVSGLFSPIVRERTVLGLQWLVEFFKDNGDFLSMASSDDNVGEFQTRLQDCVNSPGNDEAQAIVEGLAKILGIAAVAVDDELDESDESK